MSDTAFSTAESLDAATLQRVVHCLPIPAAVVHLENGSHISPNVALATLLGYEPEALEGQSLAALLTRPRS